MPDNMYSSVDNQMGNSINASQENMQQQVPTPMTKFCLHCGKIIAKDAVVCTHCGLQVQELKYEAPAQQPQIVINNANTNTNMNTNTSTNNNAGGMPYGRMKSKWVALFLCLFLGVVGAHKFYEGRVGMGLLYLFTLGLFGIGVVLDLIALIFKPNPYYV